MGAKYPKMVDFNGVAISFFLDDSDPKDPQIWYTSHSSLSDNPSSDTSWRDPAQLKFPKEIYTVGREVVTVSMRQPAPTASANFCVVSDNAYIYVFRSATNNTIYCDKFVYDQTTGKVVNATQVRYRRSRKADIPLDRKDSFGNRDMNDRPFLEPTAELGFIKDIIAGRFSVAIMPTELAGQTRWQFFVQHTGTQKLTSYSILRGGNGGFDLEDAIDPDTGTVAPNGAFTLVDAAEATLDLQAASSLIRYDQQEWQEDEYGKITLQKREMRALLAVPAGTKGTPALLDFGVGRDGYLTEVGDSVPVTTAAELQSALRFDPSIDATVAIPAITTGTQMTFEAWIRPSMTIEGSVAVAETATDADVPFTLGLDGGIPYLAGPNSTVVAADTALSLRDWTHIAAIWDGTTASLSVNGQIYTGPAPDGWTAVSPPSSGLRIGGKLGFMGNLCEMRLWKTARTQAQILADMNRQPTPGDPDWGDLMGLWPCNEPADATRFTTVANIAASGAAANGALTGATWVSATAPVSVTGKPVVIDDNGLTLCTNLLSYIETTEPVTLHEGGDSLIHLYFSNSANQAAMAAQASPIVTRASYGVSWTATEAGDTELGHATFVARIAGPVMGGTDLAKPLIAIKQNSGQTCQVTLTSHTGYKEVWPAVPQNLSDFAAVLNGRASQLTDDPAQAEDPGPVYDYTKVKVTEANGQSGPAPAEGSGSAVFSVVTGPGPSNGAPALIQAVTAKNPATRLRAGAGMRWLPYPPLLGMNQDALGQFVMLTDAGSLAIERDLSFEAWLNPTANTSGDPFTLLAYNKPGATQDDSVNYLIGLDKGVPFAGKNNIVNAADRAIPLDGNWHHLAATYKAQFGVQLGGERYIDAGNNENTKTADAVTLESWIKLDEIGGKQTVFAKTDPSEGTSWSLGVNTAGKLEFTVEQATQTGTTAKTLTSSTALPTGDWVHVAGVYDVAYERQVAINFDPTDYVKLPEVENPPKDGVTVMMWIKRLKQNNSGTQTLITSTNLPRDLPFLLELNKGVLQFTVVAGGQQLVISAQGTLRADDWVHVAATYSAADGISLILDGVAEPKNKSVRFPVINPREATQLSATEYNYTVGGTAAQDTFIGSINEVSMWSRGLSLDEVRQKIQQPLAGNERGLVGFWKFNDLFGETIMDIAGTANGVLVGGNFIRIDKGAFAQKLFVNGVMVAFERVTDPITLSDARVTLGAGYYQDYLQGVISLSRLWNRGQMNWQIDYFMTSEIPANAKGLVSAWKFETGKGGIVFDSKSDNNGRIVDGRIDLTDDVLNAMWIVADFMAGWRFYINGQQTGSLDATLPAGGYGDEQAMIGAFTLSGSFSRFFTGQMSQARVWAGQRSGAQIRGLMHNFLTGAEAKLAGYWSLGEGSGSEIADLSGNGNVGQWVGNAGDPAWQISTAPVGIEPPAILSAAGGVVTEDNLKSDYAAAAGQFGVTRLDAQGEIYAALMESMCLAEASSKELVQTDDFQLGDLVLQFIGQVQIDPTLIGYIEGAPPLPAENLKLYPGDPLSYIGASSIFLDETNITAFSYMASRQVGTTVDVNMQIGAGGDFETKVGLGVSQTVFAISASGGLAVQSSTQIETTGEGMVTEELTVTAQKYMESRGGWYDNPYQIDAGVGQIFYPDNIGYALVRSGTADLFAMRLQGSGALVGYTAQPNPDIPEDMNIIMFQMNDQYVKNGTLDGWIGFQPDTAYPNLSPGQKASYFKPLEAYAIKATIEREQKTRQAYFDNFDATALGQRENIYDPNGVDIADTSQSLVNALIGVKDKAALSTKAWREKMARRSMVNTYVWTAEGGLYSEQQQFMALREESSGGSYTMTTQAGIFTELSISPGPVFNLDAMFGTTITTLAQKTGHDSALFSLQVDLMGDQRYIGLITEDADGEMLYSRDPSPGKVRGYRFMSFYRAPSKQNFERFKDTVVNTDWLTGQGAYAGKFDPDALALRQAMTNPNEVWRLMHRVTYVNRTPPTTQNQGQSLAPDVRRPDEESVQSNVVMIAELPTNLTAPNPMVQVSTEADALLAEIAQNPVWGGDLLAKSKEFKEDIMKYMRSFYGIPS